ncbi:MAG: translation initiation factor IF-2 [Candidatus Omnitrophota bacterium]|nr:translation initiation factor IF-2 [Candidatus Omnitrophota bacterium]
MSIKVRVLAKELGVPEETVIEQLNKLYVEAEDGNSALDDKIAGLIRIKLGGFVTVKKKPKKKPVSKKPEETAKKTEKDAGAKKKKKKGTDVLKEEISPEAQDSAKGPEDVKTQPLEEGTAGTVKAEEPVRKGVSKTSIQIISRAPQEQKEEKKPEKPKSKTKSKEQAEEIFPKKAKKRKPDIEIVERDAIYRKRPPKSRSKRDSDAKVDEVFRGVQPVQSRKIPQKVAVQLPVSVRLLAPQINTKPNMIIQYLMGKGESVTINQDLDEETVKDVMAFFGYEFELPENADSMEKELFEEQHHEEDKKGETSRAPVVTFMGHVDHGKTSLLDYIRKTMVTKSEKGGITQHIGAYKVETKKGSVAFLDTPGHAAFTAMRARGANATDVVVLVVAVDDGVMPQTKEAIDHARAANVPIVVALNKCDVPGADPDRVKKELQKEGLNPEDWGGDTVMVEVSAITGQGVDHLVEMLMLESEMLELKANLNLKARGVVIESKKTTGQGVVVTLLVQNGTLYPGDVVFCGSHYGKIKAMIDNRGERMQSALPSTPVEVLGLQGVPEAGDEFFVVKDEKKAKTLALLKQSNTRNRRITSGKRVTLEDLHSRILEGSIKELRIILKADVQGSMEALTQSLEELSTGEVKVKMVHSAVGKINESDAMLAMVSEAVIIGFHVKVDSQAEEFAKREGVDIRLYDVIYEAIADVKAGMEGLLEPELKEVTQGKAKVIEVFPAKKTKAAGCKVVKGTIRKKDKIRITRGDEVIFEGDIGALKRFKDDVKEVKEGFECGLSIKGFNNVEQGDIIESFIIEKIARRLDGK